MTDQTTLCNLALQAVGTRSTISSITETSAEAIACNLQWQTALNATLRGAAWNFARRQIVLAVLNDSTIGQPVPAPWVYEYAYPTDCVMMRFIMPMFQSQPGTVPSQTTLPDYIGAPVRFLVSGDLDASGNPIDVVLTNQYQAIGVYTSNNIITTNMDPDFVEAFALILGWKIAFTLTGDKGLAKGLRDDAQGLLIRAQARNGDEGLTVIDQVPDWVRVRGYVSDWAYPDGGMFYYGPQSLGMVI